MRTHNGLTLYQINTRVWCHEFAAANPAATGLDAVSEQALDAIAAAGYDAVWLMGVWSATQTGPAITQQQPGARRAYAAALPDWELSDVIGSPFAITDYTVAPALGGNAALRRLRQRLRSRKLRLILDFVPNHVAVDHRWVTEHPDWFVQAEEQQLAEQPQDFFRAPQRLGDNRQRMLAHGRDPQFPGWIDTAQLDYRHPEVWAAMTRVLVVVAGLCDGLRCDMAMLLLSDVFQQTWRACPRQGAPPGEFWAHAIHAVRAAHPELVLVAEAYWGLESRLIELGFDYAYDKELYDCLVAEDYAGADQRIGDSAERLRWGVRFVENHDESRAAATFQSAQLQAAVVAMLTLPGIRLIQQGQENGAKIRLPVQLGRRSPETQDKNIARVYDALLPVVTSDLLRYGRWTRLRPVAAPQSAEIPVLAWQWEYGQQGTVVCVTNGSSVAVALRLAPQVPRRAPPATHWKDVLTGQTWTWSRSELVDAGLAIELAGYQARVLVLRSG